MMEEAGSTNMSKTRWCRHADIFRRPVTVNMGEEVVSRSWEAFIHPTQVYSVHSRNADWLFAFWPSAQYLRRTFKFIKVSQ